MNTLREAVLEYLKMRRSLGFKLQHAGNALLSFATFLEEQGASYITHSLALAWAKQSSSSQPEQWARRLTHVRMFARYRSALDPRTQIPPAGLLPRGKRKQRHLYSDTEIRDLLLAALKLPAHGLRPWTYYCLLGLLSVSGLRVGEAQNLELQDVDLKAGVLTIRGAKFGKSRLVPVHDSTRQVLAEYIARRERMWAGRPVSSYLYVSNRGTRLEPSVVRDTFRALCRQIGLPSPSASYGPHLRDMRHRFASMTLLRWYRAGENAERRLPILSAYLGHVHWSDTYWYLSAMPELMQEAMSRLEQNWEHRS
jgi:integrase/recombinase XerD